jgi:hypothetical protein
MVKLDETLELCLFDSGTTFNLFLSNFKGTGLCFVGLYLFSVYLHSVPQTRMGWHGLD